MTTLKKILKQRMQSASAQELKANKLFRRLIELQGDIYGYQSELEKKRGMKKPAELAGESAFLLQEAWVKMEDIVRWLKQKNKQ